MTRSDYIWIRSFPINSAFFAKQWGEVQKKKSGWLLDARTWDEMQEGATVA